MNMLPFSARIYPVTSGKKKEARQEQKKERS
jgi:hypothetical protein